MKRFGVGSAAPPVVLPARLSSQDGERQGVAPVWVQWRLACACRLVRCCMMLEKDTLAASRRVGEASPPLRRRIEVRDRQLISKSQDSEIGLSLWLPLARNALWLVFDLGLERTDLGTVIIFKCWDLTVMVHDGNQSQNVLQIETLEPGQRKLITRCFPFALLTPIRFKAIKIAAKKITF